MGGGEGVHTCETLEKVCKSSLVFFSTGGWLMEQNKNNEFFFQQYFAIITILYP